MTLSDDSRALAQRHTSQLLKMLRGYGSTAAASEPAVEAPPKTALPEKRVSHTVADVAGQYHECLEAAKPYKLLPTDQAVVPTRRLNRATADAAGQYHERLEAAKRPKVPPTDPAAALTNHGAASRPHPGSYRIATVGEALYRQKGVLGDLLAQAEQRVKLNRIFHAYLPPHLHDHAALIRMDEEAWVVHTDTASWATRLRYALHNIRETLGMDLGIALPKPHIRVVPIEKPVTAVRPPLKLTKRSAKVLESAARNQSHEPLSAALRRLAAHANSTS
jgi:hypothetical protein